jgi:hypothetical protein
MDRDTLNELKAKLASVDQKTAMHLIEYNDVYRAKLVSLDPGAFDGGQKEKDEFLVEWDASHDGLVVQARAVGWIK